MESNYPYRVAWHRPTDINVCSESRSAVLDAMEYGFPTSKNRLEALTGLGTTTVRRAYRQLIREGVMALKYGRDPDSGRASDLLTFVRYPVLPVLEITNAYMVWRLCDTRGGSVFATVRDRGGFCTPEDDLITLMGQVSAISRAGTCGLPAKVPLQPPVLLLPSRDSALVGTVRRVLDVAPTHILTPGEAAALELRYHPATQNAASVLYLRIGEARTITMMTRTRTDDGRSPFAPAACASGLEQTLRDYTKDHRPHTRGWWQQTAAFLSDFCRFITPDCVVLELDREQEGVKFLRASLPASLKFIRINYALNTPSLAHRGALRLTRRVLWDSMEGVATEKH